MSKNLSVSQVVKVTVNLQALASPRRNFGTLLIVGSSEVISQSERIRSYTTLDAVASDFGLQAPEYQAAALYYSQTPRPSMLQIGRWVKTPASALLQGSILSAVASDPDNWRESGELSMDVPVGTNTVSVTVDLSDIITLEEVAERVSLELMSVGGTCEFDGERFVIKSIGRGSEARVNYATGPLAELMALTEDRALQPILGVDNETPVDCVAHLAEHNDWYGLMFADTLSIEEHVAVAGFIQGTDQSRIYGVTVTDSRVLDVKWTKDLASVLKPLNFTRTFMIYAQNQWAVASLFGRAFTVNFNANRSTITLKFKQMPGVAAESLKSSQAATLTAKRCNVFVNYDNGTAIVQEGVMSGQAYFDEIHGLDWLQNAVQNETFNLLYQSKTKIPQTDSGVNQIVTTIESVLGEARNNGLIAPGQWNADGFGELERGDYLDKGYYIYAQRVDAQPQSEREQRKAPPIQTAVKLAGAIHFADIQIDVNR